MSNLKRQFKKLQDGNMDFFDEIYYATYKSVYMASYTILNDEEAAKDVMQATYQKLLEKIKTIDVSKYPKAWLITVARNLSLNEYKKRKREIIVDVTDPINQSVMGSSSIYETPTIELAKKILPEDEYTILIFCAIDNYKRREVSEILAIPIGTVTWKYNNAIKKMKDAMKEV